MQLTPGKDTFVSPKIQCNTCNDIIYSRYPGDFATCKCFRSSEEKVNEKLTAILARYPHLEEDHSKKHEIGCKLADKYSTGVFLDATRGYYRIGGAGCMDGYSYIETTSTTTTKDN